MPGERPLSLLLGFWLVSLEVLQDKQVAFSALAKPVASADLILAGMQVCWIVRRYKTDSNTAG